MATAATLPSLDEKEEIQNTVGGAFTALEKLDAEGMIALWSPSSTQRDQVASLQRQLTSMTMSFKVDDIHYDDWAVSESSASLLCAWHSIQRVKQYGQRVERYNLSRLTLHKDDAGWRIVGWNDNPQNTPGDSIAQGCQEILSTPPATIGSAIEKLPKMTWPSLAERFSEFSLASAQQGDTRALVLDNIALEFAIRSENPVCVANARYARAYVDGVSGLYRDGVKETETALTVLGAKFPVNAIAHHNLAAILLMDIGNCEEAEAQVNAALALYDPKEQSPLDKASLLQVKGNVELRLSKPANALEIADELIGMDLYPGVPALGLILKGRALASTGEWEKAEAALQDGIAKTPAAPAGATVVGRLFLTWTLIDAGSYGRAMQELELARSDQVVLNDPATKYVIDQTWLHLLNQMGDTGLAISLKSMVAQDGAGKPTLALAPPVPVANRFQLLPLIQYVDGEFQARSLEIARLTSYPYISLPSDPEKLQRLLQTFAVGGKIDATKDVFDQLVTFTVKGDENFDLARTPRIEKALDLIPLLVTLGREGDAREVARQIEEYAKGYRCERTMQQVYLSLAANFAHPKTLEQADEYLRKAEAIGGSLNGTMEELEIRGRIEEARGNEAAAADDYRKCLDVADVVRQKNPDPILQMGVGQYVRFSTYRLARYHAKKGDAEEAFRADERVKGRGLLEGLTNGLPRPPELTTSEKALLSVMDADEQRAKAAADERDHLAELGRGVKDLRFELKSLQLRRWLYLEGLASKAASNPMPPVKIASGQEVGSALKSFGPKAAFVSITIGDDGFVAFVAKSGQEHGKAFYVPGSGPELTDLLARFRVACSTKDGAFPLTTDGSQPPNGEEIDDKDKCAALGKECYRTFIKPIESEIEDADELVVAADGDLAGTSLACFVDDEGKFLIEKKVISYIPSASVLCYLASRPRATSEQLKASPLVIGHPAFTPLLADRLPGSSAEAKGIADSVHAQAVEDEKATEERVKEAFQKSSFIHLATHGIVDLPAEFCWIALAKSDGEDGRLEMWEVRGKPLAAKFVFLSACNSGAGDRVFGEGVVGFGWSLMEDGCPTIGLTLWETRDEISPLLLSDFYDRMLASKPEVSKAKALAEAQRAFLQANPEKRHPYYWACYFLYGDGR